MTYRALDLLTEKYAPKVSRREPYWRPRPVKPTKDVRTPRWAWEAPIAAEAGEEIVDLDVNGAYVAAITSGEFAHGTLERTGPNVGTLRPAPGYYLIRTPAWQVDAMPSPLGSAELGDTVWITAPTLGLVYQLAEAGFMDWPETLDSYTADSVCRLRKWGEALRDHRHGLIVTRNAAPVGSVQRAAADKAYQEFKDGFSIAVQLMAGVTDDESGQLKTGKSKVLRPDWYHTIHAQHGASMWRKVWAAYLAGFGPYSMSITDQVAYLARDWNGIGRMEQRPFQFDPTGLKVGAFDLKGTRVTL